MCGPSGAETSDQKQMDVFSTLLRNNYGQLFNEQQGVLDHINSSLSPIVAAGPSQRGFSGAETSALQTQAINNAGAANTAAQQAARTYGAGQGGGATSGITSGITKQIEGAIAGQEAGQLGTNLNNINIADFSQGNQNYWKALGGMQQLGSQYSPNAAQTGAIGSGETAFSEANTINQQQNAMAKDIAGFATAAVGAAPDIIKAFG